MEQFFSFQDIDSVPSMLQRAERYQNDPWCDQHLGRNKIMGLLFFNPSLRTRVSTQLAARQLGMECMVMNVDKDGWALEFEDGVVMNGSTVEHIRDAAPVLGQYFDVIGVRTFPGLKDREYDYSEKVFNAFVQHAGVPVISLESATRHPLQSFADLITMAPLMPKDRKAKVVLAWGPHIKPIPQCVANSFAEWMLGWDQAALTIAHPQGYELHPEFTQGAAITNDLKDAIQDADFVYVKNWSAYEPYGQILPSVDSWMLELNQFTHQPQTRIMHCLPVRRDVELGASLIESQHSLIQKQAANRVIAAQVVLAELLKIT